MQSSAQIDDQRFVVSPTKERDMELSSLLQGITKNSGRLENQRSTSNLQQRMLSLTEITECHERVSHQLDNQRYCLTPEKERALQIGEVIHRVEHINGARFNNQDSRTPQDLRGERLDRIADLVERLNSSSFDDQRFVKQMAAHLKVSEKELRESVESLPSYKSQPESK